MNRVGKFEKVSFGQFFNDMKDTFGFTDKQEEEVRRIYDGIKLPERATAGSAGYDFKAPFDIKLYPGDGIKVPTGIRVKIEEGWWLGCLPRSSLGFKYRLQLDNSVGVIDQDFYYSDNGGHIFLKMTNDSKSGKTMAISAGDGFAQGIFLPFGITVDDDVTAVRNGGFGSTGA